MSSEISYVTILLDVNFINRLMQIFSNKKRTIRLRSVLFFVSMLVLLSVSFWFGFSYGRGEIPFLHDYSLSVSNKDGGKPGNFDFSIYWDAWNQLIDKSLVKPDQQQMIYGSISGMLASLNDPYTVFFTPTDAKRFNEDIQGQFDGIGVELVQKNGLPTVVAPLSKSPAETAGLKAADIITAVDGTKTADMGFNEVVDKIRGPKGSKVTLTISRVGKDKLFDVAVTRDTIVVKSVDWSMKDESGKNIALVKVNQFGDDTDSLFSQFVDDALKNKVDGIVVDLRDNPGGYLNSAVDLASYFIDSGTVVIEKGKDNQSTDYTVTNSAKLKGIKTVVLVNGGTASASEIFTGAMQDHKTGEVIGEKTFGKGCVQEVVTLKDGSAVKITVADWLTPNGRAINNQGLTPDIVLTNPDNNSSDDQLNRAFQFLTKGE